MLSTKQDNDSVALGVEAAWDVEETLLDDLLNAVGADGKLLVEGIIGSPSLDKLQEGGGLVRHFGCS